MRITDWVRRSVGQVVHALGLPSHARIEGLRGGLPARRSTRQRRDGCENPLEEGTDGPRRASLGLSGRAVVSSTGWLSVAQATSLVLGFLVWAYVARVLSTDGFAQAQLGNAVGTYLALAVAAGLNTLAIAEIRAQRSAYRYIVSIQRIRTLHAAIVIACLVVFAAVSRSPALLSVATFAAVVVARQLWPEWADVALGASYRVTIGRTVYFSVFLVLTLIFVRHADQATVFGLTALLSSVAVGGVWWLLTRADARRREGVGPGVERVGGGQTANPIRWTELMRRALPYGLGGASGQILANADLVLLGALADSASVATYGAAYRIILAVQGVGVALRQATLRVLASEQESGRRASQFRTRLLAVTVGVAVLGACVVALLAPWIMKVAFGNEFRAGAPLLRILVWSWPIDFAGALVLNYLIVDGRSRAYMSAMATAAFSNLVGNVLAIPRFGAMGAAVVTLLSFMVLFLHGLILEHRGRKRREGELRPRTRSAQERYMDLPGLAAVAAGIAGAFFLNAELGALGVGLNLLAACFASVGIVFAARAGSGAAGENESGRNSHVRG